MMPRLLRIALVSLLFIVSYLFVWCLLIPSHDPVSVESPRVHGVDVITEGWNGELTAYKWNGKRYVFVWRRM
jgi:hypothetical protein